MIPTTGLSKKVLSTLLSAAALLLLVLATYGTLKFFRLAELRLTGEVSGIGSARAQVLDTWLSDRLAALESIGNLVAEQRSVGSTAGFDTAALSSLGYQAVKLDAAFSGNPVPGFSAPATDESGQLQVVVTAPVNTAAVKGFVQGDLDLAVMRDMVNRIRFKQLGHAFLIDEHAIILAHPFKELVGKPLASEFNGEVTMTDTLQPVQSSIGKRLLAFFPLTSAGSPKWYLVADINRGEAHDSLTYFTMTAVTLLLAGVLLSAAGSVLRRRS